MRRVAAGSVVVIIGCFLLLGTADAGWVIHSRTSGSGSKAEQEVSYFQRDRVRTEASGGAHVMDFAARKIIMIDTGGKKYNVMTFEEFKKIVRESMKASRQAMDEMKRQGIPVPGTASRPKGKVTVSRLSGATVAGYECDGYRVSAGGGPREDIWVTRKIDLMGEIGPAAWKEFEDLSREMKNMGMDSDEYEGSAEYRKIMEGGYPMKFVDRGSGLVREVTLVEKKTISASLFEEPKGYEKVPHDKMTYGTSAGAPASGKGIPQRGETMRPETERSAGEGAAGAAGAVGGRATDYGKQSAEEAKGAASRGAQEPVQEKKGEVLDSIREGTKEGVKKLFKW
jgi:hypothetical protein